MARRVFHAPSAARLTSKARQQAVASRTQIASDARYRSDMGEKLRMTIAFEGPDENGWIVAQVVEVPGAISQGRTREEARDNVVDALRLMLSPDDNETTDGVALELLLSA